MTFWDRWVWPANGSGGIPGDVVATLIWVIVAAIFTAVFWPPLRHGIEAWFHRHLEAHLSPHLEALHEKIDKNHKELKAHVTKATKEKP